MPFADRLAEFPIVLKVAPPTRRASEPTVRKFVKRVQEAVREIPRLDAVNIPEILDENHAGRPFYRNLSPRRFAGLLNIRFSLEPIANKVVVHLGGMGEFDAWAKESLDAYGLRNFVLVGGANGRVRYPGPTVALANERLQGL